MSKYLGRDTRSIQKSIVEHVEYTLAMTRFDFSHFGCFQAVAYSLRDRMLESLNDTNSYLMHQAARRVNIISPDYSLGRMAPIFLLNNGLTQNYKIALSELDFNLNEVLLEENDFEIGTGPSLKQMQRPTRIGLTITEAEVRGCLAADLIDSTVSFNLPSVAYGIKFTQASAN